MRKYLHGLLSIAVGASLVCWVRPTTGSAETAAPLPAASLARVAQRYLVARVEQMVTPASGPRKAIQIDAPVRMSAQLSAIAKRDSGVLAARRLAGQAGGVTYISSAVKVTNAATSNGASDTTVLKFNDDTRLYFKPVPGAPAFTESVVPRTFVFSAAGNLLSTSLDDKSGPLPTTDS